MKKVELHLKLENIYGGDGFERLEEREFVTLKRERKTVVVRHDLGVPIERLRDEIKKEKKWITINTFKREDGKPLLRLGGAGGKLWGVLREALHLLVDMGVLKSRALADRVMKAVRIEPTWVELQEDGMFVDEVPQVLNTPGSPMILMYFDVIPKSEVCVEMTYPEAFDKVIKKALELIPTINALNKRKGRVNVIKVVEK